MIYNIRDLIVCIVDVSGLMLNEQNQYLARLRQNVETIALCLIVVENATIKCKRCGLFPTLGF